MNAKQFFKELADLGDLVQTSTEKVNTCNAWGFGGWFGTKYNFIFDGAVYELRDGQVSTRHSGTFKILVVYSYDDAAPRPKGHHLVKLDAKPFLADRLQAVQDRKAAEVVDKIIAERQ